MSNFVERRIAQLDSEARDVAIAAHQAAVAEFVKAFHSGDQMRLLEAEIREHAARQVLIERFRQDPYE